jgi:hypothetical protein
MIRIGTLILKKERGKDSSNAEISVNWPMQTDGRIANAILRVLEPCEVKVSRTVLRGERRVISRPTRRETLAHIKT